MLTASARPITAPAPRAFSPRRRVWLVLLTLYLLCWAAALIGSSLHYAASDNAMRSALDTRNIAEALKFSTDRGSAADRFAWSVLTGLGLPMLAAATALPILAWRGRGRRSATKSLYAGYHVPQSGATAGN